jgi:hypothetical protein
MQLPLRTTCMTGPHACAQDYLVYWARMTGKGAEVGRLQRWLLKDVDRVARICNPWNPTAHCVLLRSCSGTAEAVRLTSAAAHVNIEPALSVATKALLSMPDGSSMTGEARGGAACSLAAAALDLRRPEQALELLKHALVLFQACTPATRFSLIRCQMGFFIAHVLLQLGRPGDAMAELENVLKETQVRVRRRAVAWCGAWGPRGS